MSIIRKHELVLSLVACCTALLLPASLAAFDQPWDSGHNTTNMGGPGPSGPSGGPGQGGGGDPVNLAFGNLAYSEDDLLIPGLGFSLRILRFYNSQDRYNGPFGYGWHCVPLMNLVEVVKGSAEKLVIVKRGDGVRLEFTDNGDGSYTPTLGWHYQLAKLPDRYTLRERGGTTHTFDLAGRLLKTVDRNENQLTFGYDGAGQIVSIADARNRKLTLAYGGNGKISTVGDFAGRTWSYRYDANDNLVSVTDPLGHVKTYGYDGDHRLISVDQAGGVSLLKNTYDAMNRVLTQTYGKGTFTFTYNDGSTVVKNRREAATTVTFTAAGNITSILDPSGLTTTLTYDGSANLLRVADTDGNTDFSYDDGGNILSIRTPTGLTTSYTYDPATSQLVTATDPGGRTTSYAYDGRGNLTKETTAPGQDTTYEYDAADKLVRMTRPNGHVTTFSHSEHGYLTSVTDTVGPSVYTLAIEYDAVGNVTRIVPPSGNALDLQWNPIRQPTRFTDHGTTPPRVVEYAYDAANRLIKIAENGQETSLEYDNLWLTKITYPDGSSAGYRYSDSDLLTGITDRAGTTSYAYDPMERVTGVTYPDTSAIGLTYANDYLVRIAGPGKDLQYTYDAERRLTKVKDAATGREYSFSYNDDGSRKEMTDPAGGKTTYGYDARGRLTGFTPPGGTTTTLATPVPLQRSITLNQIIDAYNLNETAKFISLVSARGSGNVVASYRYEHQRIRIQGKTILGAKRWASWVAEEFSDVRGMYMVKSPLEILK